MRFVVASRTEEKRNTGKEIFHSVNSVSDDSYIDWKVLYQAFIAFLPWVFCIVWSVVLLVAPHTHRVRFQALGNM